MVTTKKIAIEYTQKQIGKEFRHSSTKKSAKFKRRQKGRKRGTIASVDKDVGISDPPVGTESGAATAEITRWFLKRLSKSSWVFCFVFIFLPFLGLLPQHMGVPMLGVESKL